MLVVVVVAAGGLTAAEMGFIRASPLTLNAGGDSQLGAVAALLVAVPAAAAGSSVGTTISGTKVSTLG